MSEPKEIKESYMVRLDSLDIIAYFQKLSIAPGEGIKAYITTKKIFILKIFKNNSNIYRNIKWVGYMKNTLLDKKTFSYQSHFNRERLLNNNEYDLIDIITIPIRPILL